jgi:large conductance mechanosensitive channel
LDIQYITYIYLALNDSPILTITKSVNYSFKTKAMSIIKEFKQFAMKGNVVDLAVAVIIGTAFGKIVSSFVNDILMPPLGVLLGGIDFKDLRYIMIDAIGAKAAVTINYGMFVQTVIDFMIIAFAIFMMIKAMNMAKRDVVKVTEAPAPPPADVVLLTEIRDLLKAQK